MPRDPDVYRALAERSWTWVQSQVRTNEAGFCRTNLRSAATKACR